MFKMWRIPHNFQNPQSSWKCGRDFWKSFLCKKKVRCTGNGQLKGETSARETSTQNNVGLLYTLTPMAIPHMCEPTSAVISHSPLTLWHASPLMPAEILAAAHGCPRRPQLPHRAMNWACLLYALSKFINEYVSMSDLTAHSSKNNCELSAPTSYLFQLLFRCYLFIGGGTCSIQRTDTLRNTLYWKFSGNKTVY